MRRTRLETFHLMPRIPAKDNEGNTYVEYGTAVEFTGESWPASGKVQAQMYGEKLPYVRNIKIQGDYSKETAQDGTVSYVFGTGLSVREKDGLCLETMPGQTETTVLLPDGNAFMFPDGKVPFLVQEMYTMPDYEIISITPYKPLRMEAMKR